MTQSLQISQFGGPEKLKLISTPSAPLFPLGVRIQVTASGVNFADLMMRMGLYPEAPRPPFIPGYEIAGKVIELGEGVNQFQLGDRVLAGCRFGGYSSEVVLPANQVRKVPAQLTDVEAAAIPVNFLTAWIALQDMARIRKNDRVLIQSASGGVGVAAIQIAVEAGAHVTGLVSSLAKVDKIKDLGIHEVMTYEDWEKLNPRPQDLFDVILDSTGGASLKRSFSRLRHCGRIIHYGASSIVGGEKRSFMKLLSFVKNTTFFTPVKLMMENKGVFGLNCLQLFPHFDPTRPLSPPSPIETAMDRVLEKFQEGRYRVVVGKTFPLSEGGAAHSFLQSRRNVGKVILTHSP